jgi:hypothetical protein
VPKQLAKNAENLSLFSSYNQAFISNECFEQNSDHFLEEKGVHQLFLVRVVEKPSSALFFSTFQLRYLQTLNSCCAEKNSTIIFPVPIDVLSNFMPE